MQDQELFLFTDNWVFENCYYKWHLVLKKLSDIILRLYLAQRNVCLRLHVIHVAGTRMKALGVDGLSQGDYLEGFLALKDPMALVPLSKGAGTVQRGLPSDPSLVGCLVGRVAGHGANALDSGALVSAVEGTRPPPLGSSPGRYGNGHGGFQRGQIGTPMDPTRVCRPSARDAPVA